ncbi:MAG: DUF222 domain-containing protein [Nocardioides sp.]|uniref:HNH endonuclease signature motif containing protein n=1 Tax=Nocardioides sp. TaxID=35761 RepID=UPI0039E33D30
MTDPESPPLIHGQWNILWKTRQRRIASVKSSLKMQDSLIGTRVRTRIAVRRHADAGRFWGVVAMSQSQSQDSGFAVPGAPHPILRAVAGVNETLAGIAELGATFLTMREKEQVLREAQQAAARLEALRLAVMAAASDIAAESGAKDASAWCASELHLNRGEARADARLAAALDRRWTGVGSALAEGQISPAHTRVIVRALEDLPDDLDELTLRRAESDLIGYAGEFAPLGLARLGRWILEKIDPVRFEAEEAARLAEDEARDERSTRLGFRRNGDGTTDINACLPSASAHRLATVLDAFTQPRRQHLEESGEFVSATRNSRLRGMAFCEIIEHLDPDTLPDHGGDTTMVVVTIALEDLLRDLATADLSGAGGFEGEKVTADQARRLACGAGIIPVVLGSEGQPLDLGRRTRLYSRAQRRAIRLRDGGCQAEGCDIPAAWTDVHHLLPWSEGGATDLENGISLCGHHHRRAHDPAYEHTRLANGAVRFHRRT